MKTVRTVYIVFCTCLALVLIASELTAAQGPGPENKVASFIPASPTPLPTAVSSSPDFHRAAETALQAYLEAHGTDSLIDQIALDEGGHPIRVLERPEVTTEPIGAFSADPIQVLSGDGNYFLKVDLDNARVRVRTMLANNDAGGLQPLSGIKARLENQGYTAWAIVNADLFSSNCPPGVNCGQGLTYIDGQHKPNWSAYGETWRVRGNIGLDSSLTPEISVGDFQTRRHMTVAGGPRILMSGGSPTCNPQYDSGTGKTYFPASGEYFDGDVRYWCSDPRPITVVGISSDGRYLFVGISKDSKYVLQLAQWLKDRGAYEILRFDSGSSTGMYHNGQLIGGTDSKPIANALAVIVMPDSGGANRPPNTPQPTSPGDWYVARDGRAPTLCWQNNGDPDGDAVQFFAEVFESAVNAQSGWINDTCWRPAALDGRYYGYQWRVKARDSRGAESGWSSVWHFTIEQPPAPPDTPWQAQYWDNNELRGSPRVNTTESGLYLVRHWGWGNGPHGLPADNWSARFVKTVYFPGGFYRFHCHKDDACRLYIDGQLRIDQWWDSSFEGGDWGGNLSAGNHEIKVEYYEKTGYAALEVWWQGSGFLPYDENCDQNNAWCAEYYLNREVLGTAALKRSEGNNLWFDWGAGGPASTFPTDNFSTRFRRNVPFTCGTYRFNLFSDDGVRFWVDDIQRLHEWRDQVASFSVDVSLTTGVHNLRVEHYENGGGAALHFGWEKLADCAPSVTVDYASTHYVRPGASVDPAVRVRVTGGYLDGSRGDHLAFVGGSALGASSTQPVYGLVNEGSTYTFDVANNSAFRMTAPSSEGTYESRWQVKAARSLIGPQAAVRVVVDGTPPSIAIGNPTQGAYLNGNTVTVQALPQDAGGIDQVQFFVGYDNGSGWSWYNLGWDLDGSDGWNRTWDAAGVPDQAGVAFYAYAWDRAGNGAGTAVWDVTLDRTPPTTAIRPLAATQDSTAFVVWWDATDSVAGVDRVEVQERSDDGEWRPWLSGPGYWNRARYIGELGHQYSFQVRAMDRAGNTGAWSSPATTFINPCSGDSYEPDNGAGQARQMVLGSAQQHSICGNGDEDWVEFWAERGQRYVIWTGELAVGPDFSFNVDTVLTLYASDGTTVLAENDDISDSIASRIEWIAQQDGWLYARVRHYDSRIAGNAVTYVLRLEQGYRVYLPLTVR